MHTDGETNPICDGMGNLNSLVDLHVVSAKAYS